MKRLDREGVLAKNDKGWRKGLNMIAWNETATKYDLRDSPSGHEKVTRKTEQ